ncbi:hypothetical protein PP175_21440 [Aneurinibacillus sp. Ricciae_BoGa-3]|uniref:hypothetical protein n=1 Tax=Aneurinibacillus sp. Ricciae_BoGa-3 TaxID=3022697 RepID=UPI0023423EE8|nr:hypothetical protein [Aneurinibacillus sp. Ricciae_BoGa-3]WCK53856.1 hypothetical protein PP175_21440 [Aneurinibacillus sp. Ricciae_BoGa-3]
MISQMTSEQLKSLRWELSQPWCPDVKAAVALSLVDEVEKLQASRAKIIHLSQLSALQRNMKGENGMNVSNAVYEATKVLAEWKESQNK